MESLPLALSPTTAGDFKNCPQLFKFRAVDRLPEAVSLAAARGSLVHAALEHLFGERPHERTPQRADEILVSLWHDLRHAGEERPDGREDDRWIEAGRKLLTNYFKLEDPRAFDANQLEWRVEYELEDIHLRGVIDRLEIGDDGSWSLTDYKTGRVPGESRELAAFFGLRFYALMCWRAFGVLPREIRLVYLSDPAVLTLNPHERMLVAFERQIGALATAIRRALLRDDWRARPSPFCMSCPHQVRCPAWATAAATESVDDSPPR